MFKTITNIGARMLKRRINSPSANPIKIEKWYENLKILISKSDNPTQE